MNCKQSSEHMMGLVHHELSSSDETAVLEHLAQCSVCNEELRALRAISRALQVAVPIEPGRESRAELENHIEASLAGIRVEQKRSPGASGRPSSACLNQKPFALQSGPRAASEPLEKPRVAALSPAARDV